MGRRHHGYAIVLYPLVDYVGLHNILTKVFSPLVCNHCLGINYDFPYISNNINDNKNL